MQKQEMFDFFKNNYVDLARLLDGLYNYAAIEDSRADTVDELRTFCNGLTQKDVEDLLYEIYVYLTK